MKTTNYERHEDFNFVSALGEVIGRYSSHAMLVWLIDTLEISADHATQLIRQFDLGRTLAESEETSC